MAKFKLDLDFDYDFILLGISCHVKDYRLAWSLNKDFNIGLVKEQNIEYTTDNDEVTSYSYYAYYDDIYHLKYMLIANQGTRSYLLPEHKPADFFLILEGYYDMIDMDSFVKEVKNSRFVLTAFQLDPSAIKSRQNLIFE